MKKLQGFCMSVERYSMMERLGEDRNQKPWPGPSAIVTSCEGWRESCDFLQPGFPLTEQSRVCFCSLFSCSPRLRMTFTVFIHPPSLGKGAKSISGSLFVFLRTVGCAEVGFPFTPNARRKRHRQTRLGVENIALERQLQVRVSVMLAAHS